jgi:hypothetical protein
MTRTEILAQYQVGSDGVIRSPGKFEGEMLYVPFYWDIAMNGRRSLRLYESDLGFVHAY